MGLFDGILGGLFGDSDSTTTQRTEFPEYYENALKALFEGSVGGMAPYLEDPTYRVAPMDPRQLQAGSAFDSVFNRAMNTNYEPGYMNMVGSLDPSMGRNFTDDFGAMRGRMDPFVGRSMAEDFMGQVGRGGDAQARAGDFATITGEDALALGNPFAQSVLDAQERQSDRAFNRAASDIGGKYAREASFGGSGEAIALANLGIDREDRARDAAAQVMYDSYGQGANLASQNMQSENAAIGREVSTMLANLNRDLSALGAADSAQNSYFNRGQGAANFDMNALTGQQGAANDYFNRDMSRQGFNADMYGLADDAASRYMDRASQAGATLYDYGSNFQSQNQREMDAPWTQFSRFSPFFTNIPTTSYSTEPGNNTGGMGTALTLASMFGGF